LRCMLGGLAYPPPSPRRRRRRRRHRRYRRLLRGVERADSVALGPQKWLFAPRLCALTLFPGLADEPCDRARWWFCVSSCAAVCGCPPMGALLHHLSRLRALIGASASRDHPRVCWLHTPCWDDGHTVWLKAEAPRGRARFDACLAAAMPYSQSAGGAPNRGGWGLQGECKHRARLRLNGHQRRWATKCVGRGRGG
jgi:hypothetical protein